jgi:ABC-type uncharacterized transport system substrate-binding protein
MVQLLQKDGWGAIQSAARSSGLEVSPLGGRDARDIERTVTEFAGGSNRGLIAIGGPLSINNQDLIISLAARYRLPAVYAARFFVTDGGLVSYGPDTIDRTGKVLATWIASSKAKNPPTFQCRARPNSSW